MMCYEYGSEEMLAPKWDRLRHFIRYGKGDVKFSHSDDAMIVGENRNLRYVGHPINIGVYSEKGNSIAQIQIYNQLVYSFLMEGICIPHTFGYRLEKGKAMIPMSRKSIYVPDFRYSI